jgi:hypothetical protein
VEEQQTRVDAALPPWGRQGQVQHLCDDYLSPAFLEKHAGGVFDGIVTNPDFHKALPTLCACAKLCHKDTVIVVLLPTDFFEGGKIGGKTWVRMHLWQTVTVTVTTC